MKKILKITVFLLILISFTGCTSNIKKETKESLKYDNLAEYYEDDMSKPEYSVVKAKVIRVDRDDTKEERPDVPIQQDIRYQHLYVRILTGNHKGEEYSLRNTIEMVNPYRLIFNKGDKMYIYLFENEDGKVGNIHIYERIRDTAIIWLIIAFLALLVIVGGMKGLKAVITLVFTVLVISFIMLPLILKGYNPLLITVGAVSVTTTFSLVIISGWNRKTRTAILGTVGGVLIAAVVAWVVGQFAMLTGLGDEQANMLAYIPQNRHLDFKGILLAGIIIGALGAVMDVALSVASAMWEIEENSPNISTKKLIQSGMNIGKDVMGSMSNTLILAYVGGSIHLLLLFIAYNVSLAEILNMDMIASEIVRAVAGSIGLISAIPLTTWIGGTIGRKRKK
ncbi:YibE/F family protein [Oceanirhabdus sp. W0125-5]|uniref:YibE/F family protein n=1 Tax=Oceanirhabdus sp. W0125-5 TaxID=2999116 RepID=UPI0022F3202D|nr:YibE/F family protein [Oceanirhabdus sp. W0125-5]WBW95364.1 YibE/F family protein [Oceanirhabdus sp. W0125-5]